MIRGRSLAFPFLLLALGSAAIACGDDDDSPGIAPGVDGGPRADGSSTPDSSPPVTGAPKIAATTLAPLVGGALAAPVTFAATGDAPITWSVSAGTLPPGMTLDAATGTYSGAPTALGTSSFTVTATNARGADSVMLMQDVTAPGADAHVLLANNMLAAFNAAFPGAASAAGALTGVVAGDVLVSMDRRPVNGVLYALGFNAASATLQVYTVHPATSLVVPVGTAFGIAGSPPAGTTFGIDFNPTVDRLRVVSSTGLNLRVNPNDGALVAADANINGLATTASESAYTNSTLDATATTLYTTSAGKLFVQAPPDTGALTAELVLAPAVDTIFGFDIAPSTPTVGHVVAKLTGQTTTSFASVNLATGALTTIGTFPFGGAVGFALQQARARSVVGLTSAGAIVRFLESSAATTIPTVNPTTITAGETLVGVDFRPATGQLYGLGINSVANFGTLYRIDPRTGGASPVGLPGSIAFVTEAGLPVDLPESGYGVDFNPSVDRLRVVTSSGLNFRVNPATGAPVDGNLGVQGGTAAGVNVDGAIGGATSKLDAVAYTNGHSVMGPTAEYGIDAESNALYLVSSPNTGLTVGKLPITVNGAALDFTTVNGFDIPQSVTTATANTAVTQGSAYASLVVGGGTNLYKIDLTTGAATFVSAIGTGTPSLVGLTIGQ